MGDIGEMYNELRERRKQVAHYRGNRYAAELNAAGAEFKTEGVYRLGDFDCYPGRPGTNQ